MEDLALRCDRRILVKDVVPRSALPPVELGMSIKGWSRGFCKGLSTSASTPLQLHAVSRAPGANSGSADLQGSAGVVLPASSWHVGDAVAALQSSLVIALPTDTLYGLACDACSGAAISRIYEMKSRELSKSVAVCVADVEDVSRYATTAHLPRGLLEELLPGPVTLVLPRGDDSRLHPSLNPSLPSIGIRIPQSDFIRAVARSFGRALALTSANVSGRTSTVRVNEFPQLWPYCAYVFDAGTLPGGRQGSTIVDLTVPGIYQIIRTGSALEPTTSVLQRFDMQANE